MKKGVLQIFIIFACVLALFACACGNGNLTPTPSGGFSVTVTDQANRTVTVSGVPQRIVSGYYVSTSACIALGLKDKLVGIEDKSTERPIYSLAAPELPTSAKNVGTAKNFDLEACLSANPDLVILPLKAKTYAETLGDMGIATLVVNPESRELLEEAIGLIGKVTGTQERATALLTYCDGVLQTAKNALSALSDEEKPLVYMGGAGTFLSTPTKDMYQSSLVNLAGAKNAGDIYSGNAKVSVSIEDFLRINPEIVIIPANSMANGYDYDAEDITAQTELREVKAIKNGKIFQMPVGLESWDSPVPSGVLGALWLTATVHPELYSLEQVFEVASDFYKTFYGFDVEKSLICGSVD